MMNVHEVMTRDPACCTPTTTIQEVAQLMMAYDCGEIPVIRESDDRRLLGVITDRDVACRSVANGDDPTRVTVDRYMTSPVVTVTPDTSLDECCHLMEMHQIRRVPVVDEHDVCCGIVAQADVAALARPRETAQLVRAVSRH